MRTTRRLALAPVVLVLASCGTLLSQTGGRAGCGSRSPTLPNVYSGVVFDLQGGLDYGCDAAGRCEFFRVESANQFELFFLLDLPLSLAVDTVILPFTINGQVRHGNLCSRKAPPVAAEAFDRAGTTAGSP